MGKYELFQVCIWTKHCGIQRVILKISNNEITEDMLLYYAEEDIKAKWSMVLAPVLCELKGSYSGETCFQVLDNWHIESAKKLTPRHTVLEYDGDDAIVW